MNWEEFLREGKLAEQKVRNGLLRRGFNAGESIKTQFNTDENIPIYDSSGQKLFWISVKSTSLTGETHFLYPWYHVPGDRLLSKDEIIAYIHDLCER